MGFDTIEINLFVVVVSDKWKSTLLVDIWSLAPVLQRKKGKKIFSTAELREGLKMK